MKKIPPREALIKAVELAGGQTALARKLGVKQQTVWVWLHTELPPRRAIPIERIVNGKITRYQLRPDFYPQD